ncbi:SURF1 family protein [Ovoidimarina sediminis]|uniref:SURF1 family protein n=1 Tax=Ovoidimarina sediminis TaxID=3079856 RepID=UPI002909EE05|nr:SURF1 family protein [Rhodophyticola sp. MJ-SS7]MDU8942926.1 SURF1 family protein [Rhodophyticola sp. MJ-SS7]
MGRLIAPLLIGGLGAAVLVSLGLWQMQRLQWKENVLADIEARIAAAPVALPESPDPARDRYLPVSAEGAFGPEAIRVLVSRKGAGAGYRLISPFETGERRVLVDRGFIPVAAEAPALPKDRVTVTGNLHWPEEVDGFTPEPDRAANIWFAREVPVLAEALRTEPILIVLRDRSFQDQGVTPLPVDTSGIPNDHLKYAVTWFGLAAVWMTMTGYWVLRLLKARDGKTA